MNAIEEALYSVLSGGTALVGLLGGTTIYNGQMPRDASLPAVVFSMAAGVEDNQTPTRSNRLVYLVKGVAATMSVAGGIADEVDDLLHDVTLSITGHTNFWTARETVVRYHETDPAGHTIAHAGGEYAIRTERS